ncbi:MAG: phosphate/phosphite/phosphonate ABC transporter substrate-binding protein [Candidatus Tectomicrobia bacterium]|uniref:Phosphate/phosphite/phosphonate ABC transporter substrate-binding protein n=1 Tax=Tectimicrobiota bacterium TaxID=2528274 RepID=A0A932GNL5_UNCTE|nr:phosphate/phosphite/phosphonate ABC transporter substrate-binding protein [Candidatus Tectomicrobia bacterium]
MGRSPEFLLALIFCTLLLWGSAWAAPLQAEWPEHRIRLALGSQSPFPQALQHYQPLVNYLERKIGIPMDLVQVPEASDQLRRLDQGSVDLALVDGAVYWKYRSRLDLLGIQRIRGSLQRRALLAVRSTASIRTPADLDGKPMASADDWDTLGTLWILSAAGPEVQPRFVRASSYVAALQDVILGRAEGAAVEEDVFRHFFSRYPRYRGSVRVIATSPFFSNLALVVRRTLSAAARREFQSVVRSMGETLEGAAVLAAIGIGGFVPVDAGFFKEEELLLSRLARLGAKGDLHGVPAAIFAK